MIGDGALTGGMAWEALNNIAAGRDRNVVIVVNDNGRSYAPTIGGLADRLATLRLQPGYERVLEAGKQALARTPVVGGPVYAGLHALKAGIKDALSPQELFSDLGLKYFGPIDGHDIAAMESALRRARHFGGPVIVHAVTRKGNGYPPAENDEAEQMHSPGRVRPGDRAAHRARRRSAGPACSPRRWSRSGPAARTWWRSPRRCSARPGWPRSPRPTRTAASTSGIAEQHALTSAAGLAMAGLHPVVAVYSTFLNRAFDQLLMDVALHDQPVTLVLDRAGVTGNDGPSHNGMWDLSLLGDRARDAGGRAAGRGDPARGAGRGGRGRRRADRDALPEGRGDRVGAGAAPGRRGRRAAREPGRTATPCCWCAPGRSASWGWPRRSGWPGRGSR